MKLNVGYKLDLYLKSEIIKVKNLINTNLEDIEIYLFGSIAKGKYSKKSDIDVLILINEDKTTKELRYLRHLLEDKIEELGLSREVDIKIYNKNRFDLISKNPSFESAILNDLIDIKEWSNGN